MATIGNKRKSIFLTFRRFTRVQGFSSILLLLSAFLAFYLANSHYKDVYYSLWEDHFGFQFRDYKLSKSLHQWINDGLMVLFFFVIGLEIKRELLVGQLASIKKAMLPIIAAVGGMVVPALTYCLFNIGEPTIKGWGIPMATDLAIVLGILLLFGRRVPVGLKLFITAVAIVDDLGSALEIAIFYSSDISLLSLVIGVSFLVVLLVLNIAGVRSTWLYGVIGVIGVWFSFSLSGIHPCIAGILVAIVMPARTKISLSEFKESLRKIYEKSMTDTDLTKYVVSAKRHESITQVKIACDNAIPPLQHLHHRLHPWVSYLVIPIFTLSMVGFTFTFKVEEYVYSSISIGVIMGAVIGKVIGITLFSWLACKFGPLSLPENVSWSQIIGVGFLAGIGLTMSLFISHLAFSDETYMIMARIGILTASIISGIIGVIILNNTLPRRVR